MSNTVYWNESDNLTYNKPDSIEWINNKQPLKYYSYNFNVVLWAILFLNFLYILIELYIFKILISFVVQILYSNTILFL